MNEPNCITIDLNQYEEAKKIGKDTYYTSYKVIDKKTKKIFYGKKLNIKDPSDTDDEDCHHFREIRFFLREVDIFSKMDSPYIPKFMGFSFTDFNNKFNPTIIMEYSSNGTLLHLLNLVNEKDTKILSIWNSTKKLMVIYGIASGMQYFHSKGFIHRCLSPKCIYLDDHLSPKIADFSLSTQINTNISKSKGVGMMAYMSPELINEEDYDQSVDVYAFGVIVYEIITGKKPKINLVQKLQGKKPQISSEVPKAYANLISKCFEFDPKQRPTFEEIVSMLKTNEEFITEEVSKKEFIQYIDPIKNEFNFEKIHIDYLEKSLQTTVDPIDLKIFAKQELIGKGQFGKVFKVKEKVTGKIFAAKTNFAKIQYCDYIEIKNLSREISILSELKFPSILEFIGYNQNNFKDKPKPTIVTEFSKNKSIDEIIKYKSRGLTPKGWDDTKELIAIYGIASGMSYLHSKNIIHRDLKPANVFLDEYLFPKIGDFGLSKEVDDESTLSYDSSHYVGSPAFMAPEIFNEYNYNKASDVYAFGLLVYQMITLEEPFKDYNYFKLMIDVVSGIRPTLESNIPNCYKNLIENCWCDSAKDRPTFENIVHLLENDSEFISETVDKNEYFDYIQYIKDIKKKEEFHPVTIDFEKLKKMQQNDSRINISFLDLKRYTKHKFVKKTDNFKIYEIKNKYTGEIYEAKISNFNIEYLGKNEIIHLSREINTLSKLNHPSFIKFIGYSPVDFNQQTNPVIVTEKPPNRSLRNLLDNEEYNERWDDTKKLIVIFGISSGMKYLHSNNIIHRNLCPESIFLDEYLFPKIGNYGLLTKLHSTKSMTYQTSIGIKGNILYSSPELIAQNEYSKSSDVYAFSLIIYEIITNKKPFKNISNCNDLYNEIVNKSNRPKINSNINEYYRKLIESCWCQKAEDRPTFELITSILKNESGFITKNVNKVIFNKYIELIENSNTQFNSKNQVVKFDELIEQKIHHKNDEIEVTNFKKIETNNNKGKKESIKSKEENSYVDKNSNRIEENCIKETKEEGINELKPVIEKLDNKKIEEVISESNDDKKDDFKYDILDSGNNEKVKSNSITKIQNNEVTENKMKDENILLILSKYLFNTSDFEDKIPISRVTKGIYKVRTKSNKFYIVEIINYYEKNSYELQQYFLQLIELQASLNHEAILPMVGYFVPNIDVNYNDYGFVYEFMENSSLHSLIQKCNNGNEPDNWETIRAINIFGIASGMAYIHQHNIFHRNLKPQSIILDDNYYPKISNFDFSGCFKKETQGQCGTPLYMAPEVLEDKHYSNKIDIYSYSMILYELFTKNQPWSDQKDMLRFNFSKKVLKGERPTIHEGEIPDVWIKLITNCWAKDPNKRPSFIQIVQDFMKNKNKYFNICLNDEAKFDNYIELVTKDLNFDEI